MRAVLWLAAAYGGAVFCQQYVAFPAGSRCPTEFLAGIYQVGPRSTMSLSEIWQLLAVRGKYTSGRWKLYEFSQANPGEIAHFLVIWTKDGYPLIAFQLPDLEVERVPGPVPKAFQLRPDQGVMAALANRQDLADHRDLADRRAP